MDGAGKAIRGGAHRPAREKASAAALTRLDKAERKEGPANRSRRPIGSPFVSSLHVSEPSFMRSALPRDRRGGRDFLFEVREGRGRDSRLSLSLSLSFSFAPCSLPLAPLWSRAGCLAGLLSVSNKMAAVAAALLLKRRAQAAEATAAAAAAATTTARRSGGPARRHH